VPRPIHGASGATNRGDAHPGRLLGGWLKEDCSLQFAGVSIHGTMEVGTVLQVTLILYITEKDSALRVAPVHYFSAQSDIAMCNVQWCC
jgi:hypothetical protein